MNHTRRWLVVAGVILALPLVLSGGVALYLANVDLESYREPLEHQLSQATDLRVSVGAIDRRRFLLKPRVNLVDVRVLDRDPAIEAPIARADVASVGIDLLPLLHRRLQIDDLDLRGVRIWLESDEEGKLHWEPHVQDVEADAESGGLEVRVENVTVADLELDYRDGRSGETTRLRIDELVLDRDVDRSRVHFDVEGQLEDLDFEFGVDVAPDGAPGDAPFAVDVDGGIEGFRVEGEGRSQKLDLLGNLELKLEMRLRSLPARLVELGAPDLAPLDATLRLQAERGRVHLKDLQVLFGDHDADHLTIEGHVDDALGSRKGTLQSRMALHDQTAISHWVSAELFRLGRIEGSGRFEVDGDEVDLRDVKIVAGDEDGTVWVEGDIYDLTDVRRSEGHVRIRAPTLAAVAPGLQAADHVGPIVGTADLAGSGKRLRLENVAVDGGDEKSLWIRLEGELAWIGGDAHPQLRGQLRAADASLLEPWTGPMSLLPKLGPVEARATIEGTDWEVDHFYLHTGGTSDVQATFEGRGVPTLSERPSELRLHIEAPTLRALGELVDRPLPPVGPVTLTGLLNTRDKRVNLEDLRVEVGDTVLRGTLARDFALERPTYLVTLRSGHVRLADLGIAADVQRVAQATPWYARPVPLDGLRTSDVTVALDLRRVSGARDLDLRDLTGQWRLRDGIVDIDLIGTREAGGARGEVDARLDARGERAKLHLSAEIENVRLGRLTAQFTDRPVARGDLMVKVDTHSQGNTAHEWLRTATGPLGLAVYEGHLATKYVTALQASVFDVWKLDDPVDTVEIRCFIADLELRDGRARARTLLLDDAELTVIGTGVVDFAKGEYDLDLTPVPKARRLYKLVLPVAVRGPFADPHVSLRPTRMVQDTAATALAQTELFLPPFLRKKQQDPCAITEAEFLQALTREEP